MQICKSHLQLLIHPGSLVLRVIIAFQQTALNIYVPVVIGDGKRKSAVEGLGQALLSSAPQDRTNPSGAQRRNFFPGFTVGAGLEWSQNV